MVLAFVGRWVRWVGVSVVCFDLLGTETTSVNPPSLSFDKAESGIALSLLIVREGNRMRLMKKKIQKKMERT